MNKSFLALVILLVSGCSDTQPHSDQASDKAQLAAQNQYLPLFFISKDVNKNRVIYEATLDKNCQFDLEKPVKIYWLMGTGKLEGLNFFERKAFPINFYTKSQSVVTGDIKALKEKKLRFPLTIRAGRDNNGACQAVASAPGVAQVVSVHLSKFDGLNPKDVSVQGIDKEGQPFEKPIQRDGVSLLQIEEQTLASSGSL